MGILKMGKSVLPTLVLFSVLSANAQTVIAVPKKSQTKKPACSPGAICFSGKISEGEEFRKTLTGELEFVLRPGWTNCADYQAESDRLLIVLGAVPATPQKYDEALAKLGTSAKGRGRLWITEWKISHAGDTPDDKLGVIQQMTFSVEILLLGPWYCSVAEGHEIRRFIPLTTDSVGRTLPRLFR